MSLCGTVSSIPDYAAGSLMLTAVQGPTSVSTETCPESSQVERLKDEYCNMTEFYRECFLLCLFLSLSSPIHSIIIEKKKKKE